MFPDTENNGFKFWTNLMIYKPENFVSDDKVSVDMDVRDVDVRELYERSRDDKFGILGRT